MTSFVACVGGAEGMNQ